MPDKLPSEIIRITLDDATYKGTGAAIAPTYINYFFGNNGTGKTTIAKAIKTGSGVIYAPGKAAVDRPAENGTVFPQWQNGWTPWT